MSLHTCTGTLFLFLTHFIRSLEGLPFLDEEFDFVWVNIAESVCLVNCIDL